FTVERDGSIGNMRVEKSAGQPALDRAAQNAMLHSRFLPLPGAFRPERVTMVASFSYSPEPSPSPTPVP
ncbi:MAG: energy transducer TonB, partial [Vicinamibacteria bacterium]